MLNLSLKLVWLTWSAALVLLGVAYIAGTHESELVRVVLIGCILCFAALETRGLMSAAKGDTYSEHVWAYVQHPLARWTLGVLQAMLAAVALHPLVGLVLFAWLPMHYMTRKTWFTD